MFEKACLFGRATLNAAIDRAALHSAGDRPLRSSHITSHQGEQGGNPLAPMLDGLPDGRTVVSGALLRPGVARLLLAPTGVGISDVPDGVVADGGSVRFLKVLPVVLPVVPIELERDDVKPGDDERGDPRLVVPTDELRLLEVELLELRLLELETIGALSVVLALVTLEPNAPGLGRHGRGSVVGPLGVEIGTVGLVCGDIEVCPAEVRRSVLVVGKGFVWICVASAAEANAKATQPNTDIFIFIAAPPSVLRSSSARCAIISPTETAASTADTVQVCADRDRQRSRSLDLLSS